MVPQQRHTPHPLRIRSLLFSYSGVHGDLSTEAKKTQVGYNHPRTRGGRVRKVPGWLTSLCWILGDANFPTIFLGLAKDDRQEFTFTDNAFPPEQQGTTTVLSDPFSKREEKNNHDRNPNNWLVLALHLIPQPSNENLSIEIFPSPPFCSSCTSAPFHVSACQVVGTPFTMTNP